MNRVRCPACNKWGSKKNPDNMCKKCLDEGKAKMCMVEKCTESVYRPESRYCEKHFRGDDDVHPFRDAFLKDYKQTKVVGKEYGIVKKDFGVQERGK